MSSFGSMRRVRSTPSAMVAARSLPEGYSGTPLPKKLGIKTGSVTALIDAPPGFEKTLGALPEGATLRHGAGRRRDLVIWFTRSRRDLVRGIDRVAPLADPGGIWIAWPKKSSGMPTDLTQADIREVGLGAGLVDFKVCAVDATWSGLKFARRK